MTALLTDPVNLEEEIVKDKEKCSVTQNLCLVTENVQCNLILHIKNLITNKINYTIYY